MSDRDAERRGRDADEYIATVMRLEPDIHPIDASAFYASAAISLKRSADAAERQAVALEEFLVWSKSRWDR